MTKRLFLRALRFRISELPEEEIAERINFYSEIIDDRMEEGYSEQEAVEDVGVLDEIAAQIKADALHEKSPAEKVSDTPSVKDNYSAAERSGGQTVFRAILLILGSPIWLSVLVSVFAVLFSAAASLWAVIVSLWAVCISLGGGVLFCIGSSVFPSGADLAARILWVGIALLSAGLSIFLFYLARIATRGGWSLTKALLSLTKSLCLSIKNVLIGKRG